MKNYTYSAELTADELADPIVAAAYRVAKKAHDGEMRGKLDDVPELAHPVLVYRMARRMGETNSTFLAAALLHDTLENYKPYRKYRNHYRMREDLLSELQAENIPAADLVADRVFNLVREVTKPDVYDLGLKLLAQIDHMQHASIDGKRLKILDQAASLVCRLIGDNDPKRFSAKKEDNFIVKATNLVRAIVHSARSVYEREALAPYEHLYALCLELLQRMPGRDRPRIARNYYRNSLDFDSLFHDRIEQKRVVRVSADIVQRYYPPQAQDKSGLAVLRIDFASDGQICGCVIRNDPGGGENSTNQWQENFLDNLHRTFRLADRYQTLEVEARLQTEQENRAGRHYVFYPPVSPQVFASATRLSGLLSMGESRRFERRMLELRDRGDAPAR